MIALAISLAHWLQISISMSVCPVNSFFPPTIVTQGDDRAGPASSLVYRFGYRFGLDD